MRHFWTLQAAALLAVITSAPPAFAQGGSLEGTTVVMKIDMPASSDGVDVFPDRGGVDFRKLADRLHSAGVGVHNGEAIMITKVNFKGDHVEVQLGGGGFGTFRDRLAQGLEQSAMTAPYEGKSRREKDLERDAKYSPDYRDRRDARRELHDARNDRAMDNARAAASNAQARQLSEMNERQARAGAGSRFNIRYPGGMPSNAASPQAIRDALSRYVDFTDGPAPNDAPSASPAGGDKTDNGLAALRKGLTVLQTEQILGPADKVSRTTEGSIEMSVREYTTDNQQVTARFVGGVLVDYKIAPR